MILKYTYGMELMLALLSIIQGVVSTIMNSAGFGAPNSTVLPIYGFEEEIYGKEITVKLLRFKRPERKFHGKAELKEQMMKDMEEGMAFHTGVQMKG